MGAFSGIVKTSPLIVESRVEGRVSMVPSVESGCRGGRKHPLPAQAGLAALVTLIVLGPRFPCLVSVMICGEAAWTWTSKHTPENMYAYFYAASS